MIIRKKVKPTKTHFLGRDEFEELLGLATVIGRLFALLLVVAIEILSLRYIFPYMLSHEPFI